ncbi:otefin-like [Ochlerotatus camptorhynchus]|uniref:otefin-like n=1 Tax=Ochlerotatus camptorhynchus TaxID=644619 RepID=UPI0031E0436A
MENFDDLSNDQLRRKMLEFGMPNMPITATTRKLVVKKLKNYVDSANSKTRRDTIHVTKFSSDDDTDTAEEPKKVQKKESSRRVTIGGPASKLSKTLPVVPDLPPPKPAAAKSDKLDPANKRRSGRITPVLSKDDAPKVTASKEPVIIEDSSEEDEEMLPLSQMMNRRDRKSASPSLSRAEMVTTSYVHQVEMTAKPPILEEMEIDLTESTGSVVVEPEPEPIPERRPRPQLTPSRESHYTTNITSTSTSSKRATIGSGFSAATTPSRQSELSSSFGRPSLATTYTPREARREEVQIEPTDSPYLSEFTKRLSRLKTENAQLNALRDHPIRRTIAPSYASTRVADDNYVSSRLVSTRGQRPEGPNRKEGEIRTHLRQVILSLDQKYSIKNMFYLLIVAMVVIFLFVLFFL